MWSPRQFPPVYASAWVGNLDIVKRLLEILFVVAFFVCFVDGGEALGERVLVDVELVVELGIWIACKALIRDKAVDNGRPVSVISHQQIVSLLEVLKILQLSLQLLVCGLIGTALLHRSG